MEKAGKGKSWKKKKLEKEKTGKGKNWKKKKLEKEKTGKRKNWKRENKCLTMYPENDRILTTGKPARR